jgi:hypothetical protein
MNHAVQSLLQHPSIWLGGQVEHARTAVQTSGFAALDAELPGGGWPMGALIELLHGQDGMGEVSLLMPTLARLNQEGRGVVWVAPPHIPYAPALRAAGLQARHTLIVTPSHPADALWAAEQALRSGACGAVLAWPEKSGVRGDMRAWRRLQLAAEASGAMGFLYRPLSAADEASPAPLRLELDGQEGRLSVRVLKRRGAPSHSRVLLQLHPAHWGREVVRDKSREPVQLSLVPAATSAPRLSQHAH